MKKTDIARRMARESGVTQAEAADRLDLVVHKLLCTLRKGKTASLPGLGRFTVGADGKVSFKAEGPNRV